jgi:serine/threonine protein kinase
MDPTRLGPYTIRGRLGRGGMGTVYEAVDPEGRLVALKTLRGHMADHAGSRRRFEAEITALKELRHPGIVRLLAFGEENDQPFFAMELVRGKSLEELLKAGRTFSWQETVATALQVTRALKTAHDHGIIHRDLKPANLLFPEAHGAEDGVKLADFGIARLFGESGQTQAGTVVGTAEYMAPEQAAGEPVDQRVDLYTLGLVMYAMLVGRPPFTGSNMSDVLRRQRRETPPRVSALVPDVPEQLDLLIEKLLAKDPAARPASALAVGRLLGAIEVSAATGSFEAADVDSHRAGSTATDRAARPTKPLRSDQPAADTGVDLLAATVGGSGSVPLGETRDSNDQAKPPASAARTAGAQGSLMHRRTAADEVTIPGERSTGNRFTTLEELHREATEQAARTARREGAIRLALALGLLAAVLAGGYALLRPATSDELHARIRAVADAPKPDLRDAQPLIDLFLARFPDDPRAAYVRSLDREIDLEALERKTRRRPKSDAELSHIERDYRAAMAREAESPLASQAAFEAMLALHDATSSSADDPLADDGNETTDLWLDLIRNQINRLKPLADRERAEDLDRGSATLAEAAQLAAEAEAASPADRADYLDRRRSLLEGLIEIYAARPHMAEAVAEARRLLAQPAP